jgi:hypothetical protein
MGNHKEYPLVIGKKLVWRKEMKWCGHEVMSKDCNGSELRVKLFVFSFIGMACVAIP